jgi:peroxiredoxin
MMWTSRRVLVAAARPLARGLAAKAGDKVPSVPLFRAWPNEAVDMAAYTSGAGKKTIIVGLPGAFTPT